MAKFVDSIFDRTFGGLSRALDLTQRRNDAIVSNIANAETPQYRAVDVNFAGELERAFESQDSNLARTDAKHFDLSNNQAAAHMEQDLSGATKPDGNNVDIDIQMGKLALNSGQYSIAANLMRKQLSILKNAIRQSVG